MKTILFLSYDLPYPLDAGGKIRSYHLIRQLSKKYHVKLLYFYRKEEIKKYENKLSPYCTSIAGLKRRPVNSLTNLMYLGTFPFPAALYFDPHVFDIIDREIASGVDAIHFESFYTSMYLRPHRPIPQVLGTENIEWHVYREYARMEKNMIMRSLYNIEIQRIAKFEAQTWNVASSCLAVSPDNALEIGRKSTTPVHLVKNGVDTDYFNVSRKNRESKTILFVGNFNYIQNVDAADYLLTEIAPLIPDSYALRLVGRNPTAEIQSQLTEAQKKSGCSVTLEADLDDIRDAYQNAFVLIAPLRTGSGTKFKILESLASGVPVVATTHAAEGIQVTHEKDILIANTPQELVSRIIDLSNDKTLYNTLSKNGRKLIESAYSWDAIGKDLHKVYEKTFNNHR